MFFVSPTITLKSLEESDNVVRFRVLCKQTTSKNIWEQSVNNLLRANRLQVFALIGIQVGFQQAVILIKVVDIILT